jgi:hypothetical protein
MHLTLNMTPSTKTPLGFYVFQQSDGGEIYAAWLLRSGENTVERKMVMQLVKLFPFFTSVCA